MSTGMGTGVGTGMGTGVGMGQSEPHANTTVSAKGRGPRDCGLFHLRQPRYIRPMLHITDDIALQDWELSESFMRASGPGGQNVNKVATAVELRFEAARSPALTPAVKSRLKRLAGRRWTKEGAILLQCDETRSQLRNRELVRDRLAELILKALVAPKRRIATKPTRGSVKRRLDSKKQRSAVKSTRGKITPE